MRDMRTYIRKVKHLRRKTCQKLKKGLKTDKSRNKGKKIGE